MKIIIFLATIFLMGSCSEAEQKLAHNSNTIESAPQPPKKKEVVWADSFCLDEKVKKSALRNTPAALRLEYLNLDYYVLKKLDVERYEIIIPNFSGKGGDYHYFHFFQNEKKEWVLYEQTLCAVSIYTDDNFDEVKHGKHMKNCPLMVYDTVDVDTNTGWMTRQDLCFTHPKKINVSKKFLDRFRVEVIENLFWKKKQGINREGLVPNNILWTIKGLRGVCFNEFISYESKVQTEAIVRPFLYEMVKKANIRNSDLLKTLTL